MKITRKQALKNLSGLASLGFMGLPNISQVITTLIPFGEDKSFV